MESPGIFSLVGALLLLPFQLVGSGRRLWLAHAQRRRMFSTLELNLRRASRPVGALAVLFAAHRLYGVRIDAARAALALDDWIAAGATVAAVVGLVTFIAGARRSAGMEDGPLATWAFFKVAGGAGAIYICRVMPLRAGGEAPPDLLAAVLLLVAIWCIATGAVRFVLLVVPMQGARPREARNQAR